MHVKVGHVSKRKTGEVGIGVLQHVGSLFEMSGAKMSRRIMFRGVGPGQVVKPGLRADVAKDGPPIDVSGLARPVDVVDQLMDSVREGVEIDLVNSVYDEVLKQKGIKQ